VIISGHETHNPTMTEQKRVEVMGESLEEILHHGHTVPRRGSNAPKPSDSKIHAALC